MAQRLPHTNLIPGSIPTAVLVCGDPARAAKIAGRLDEHNLLAEQREYRTYVGVKNGRSLTITSHGIGAPGAAIAFEELIAAGAQQIIRVGTCGSMQPEVKPGHLVIASAAVQNTGYGREVVPEGYPAVADADLLLALKQTASRRQQFAHTGIVLTRDAFFNIITHPQTPDYGRLAQANVLAVEMECAALFLIGSLRGVQTAAILAVNGSVLEESEGMDVFVDYEAEAKTAVDAAIDVALNVLVKSSTAVETPAYGLNTPEGMEITPSSF